MASSLLLLYFSETKKSFLTSVNAKTAISFSRFWHFTTSNPIECNQDAALPNIVCKISFQNCISIQHLPQIKHFGKSIYSIEFISIQLDKAANPFRVTSIPSLSASLQTTAFMVERGYFKTSWKVDTKQKMGFKPKFQFSTHLV